MADIYEYTDERGGVHRVDDLGKVPKDRLKHMLVIGGEDEAAPAAAGAAAAPPPAPAKGWDAMGPQVWGVSAALLAVGLMSKKFLLRLACILLGIIWLLYNGYDVFMTSDLAKTAEKKPKPKPAAPQEP